MSRVNQHKAQQAKGKSAPKAAPMKSGKPMFGGKQAAPFGKKAAC